MAINSGSSNADYERQKFVESPTRPTNAVPEVVVGSSALPSGAATDTTLTTGIATMLDKESTGTITLTVADSSVTIPLNGVGIVGLSITGTWSGTIQFEGSLNGTDFFSVGSLPWSGTGAISTSTTGNTNLKFPVASLVSFRARRSAGTSGTANVVLRASSSSNIMYAYSQNANNFLAGVSQVGTWTVQPGNTPNTNPWLVSSIPLDGTKTTYVAVASGFTMGANPTDVFTLSGSATKTVRVLSVHISGTQTTEAIREIILLKRSTANTGGTPAAMTIVPYDSNNATATAVATQYTANPASLGTLVGNVFCKRVFISDTTKPSALDEFIWEYKGPSQAIVLRGTSQFLAINFKGVTSSGNLLCCTIKWTEE